MGECPAIPEVGGLEWRDGPFENLDLVNLAVLETAVSKSLADSDVVVPAASDVLGQTVTYDIASARPPLT